MTVAGNAQTVNECNNFGKSVILCSEAAKRAGNASVLNQTTDGVSCDVDWNKQTIVDYLNGKTSICAHPNPNYNLKNAHYQMIGGSCAACFGHYFVDLGLLFLSGVAKELYRPQDYASDALLFIYAPIP